MQSLACMSIALAIGSVCGYVDPESEDFHDIASKLVTEDTYIPPRCERVAAPGIGLWVNFVAYVDESSASERKGEMFDTTDGRGPFHFTLGKGEVIQGWDMGLAGMCKDGRRRLIVPPELAYGENGNPPQVPKNATLRFDVEIKQVMEPYDFDNIFDRIDKDKSGGLDRAEVEEFFVSRGTTTPDTLWKVEDKNDDGIISWDEFTGPKGVASTASKANSKRVTGEIVSEEVEMDQFEEFVEENVDVPIEEIQNEL